MAGWTEADQACRGLRCERRLVQGAEARRAPQPGIIMPWFEREGLVVGRQGFTTLAQVLVATAEQGWDSRRVRERGAEHGHETFELGAVAAAAEFPQFRSGEKERHFDE